MDELKPCPCGKAGYLKVRPVNLLEGYRARCSWCWRSGDRSKTRAEAVASWNRLDCEGKHER